MKVRVELVLDVGGHPDADAAGYFLIEQDDRPGDRTPVELVNMVVSNGVAGVMDHIALRGWEVIDSAAEMELES